MPERVQLRRTNTVKVYSDPVRRAVVDIGHIIDRHPLNWCDEVADRLELLLKETQSSQRSMRLAAR